MYTSILLEASQIHSDPLVLEESTSYSDPFISLTCIFQKSSEKMSFH